jgi:hypothetical protein
MTSPLPLYRPSNHSDFESFEARYCSNCREDQPFRDGETNDTCPILLRALLDGEGGLERNKQWKVHPETGPFCTGFQSVIPTDREVESLGQTTLFEAA